MPRSVFVSYKYEDAPWKDKVIKWSDGGLLGDVVTTGETKDARREGPSGIREHLDPRVRGAAAIVVLVGDDSHSSRWIRHEIAFANEHNKLVVPVRIPRTSGAVPQGAGHLLLVDFDPHAVRRALERP